MSFELGIPATKIDEWPDSELMRYAEYSKKHMLPKKRQEFYLAQIAYMVAVTMGGFDGEISDLMLKTSEKDEDEEPQEQNDDDSYAESQFNKLG